MNYNISRFLFSIIVLFLSMQLYGESVFLKNGSIIEGKIISETDIDLSFELSPDKKKIKIMRKEIIRTLYSNDYKNKMYIYMTNGKMMEAHIVFEEKENYIFRKELLQPHEIMIPKSFIKTMSKFKIEATKKDKISFYLRGLIPGWGQFYAENEIRGYTFSGIGGASLLAMGYFFIDYQVKYREYKNLGDESALEEFDETWNDTLASWNRFKISAVVFGVIYLANWVDLVFFTDLNTDTQVSYYKQEDMKISPNFMILDTTVLQNNEMQYRAGVGYRF